MRYYYARHTSIHIFILYIYRTSCEIKKVKNKISPNKELYSNRVEEHLDYEEEKEQGNTEEEKEQRNTESQVKYCIEGEKIHTRFGFINLEDFVVPKVH